MSKYSVPVEHVTKTAWMVAAYRVMESERPDAKFNDLITKKLLLGNEDELFNQGGRGAKLGLWFLTVRTSVIDRTIERLVREGVDTVVNLGAGLDTRPYRLDIPETLRWIEADYPDTVEFKNERLAGDLPKCGLERVSADLSKAEERSAVLRRANEGARKLLVLTEGVLPYLEEKYVVELAGELREMSASHYWLMDATKQRFMEWMWKQFSTEREAMQSSASTEIHFRPTDPGIFFAEHGWKQIEYTPFGTTAEKIDRLPKEYAGLDHADREALDDAGIALFEKQSLS